MKGKATNGQITMNEEREGSRSSSRRWATVAYHLSVPITKWGMRSGSDNIRDRIADKNSSFA